MWSNLYLFTTPVSNPRKSDTFSFGFCCPRCVALYSGREEWSLIINDNILDDW